MGRWRVSLIALDAEIAGSIGQVERVAQFLAERARHLIAVLVTKLRRIAPEERA